MHITINHDPTTGRVTTTHDLNGAPPPADAANALTLGIAETAASLTGDDLTATRDILAAVSEQLAAFANAL